MKKALAFLVIIFALLVGCKKYKDHFLEEPVSLEGVEITYHHHVVEDADQILRLGDKFQKSEIKPSERSSYNSYSKVFRNSEKFPVRIENYRKDAFNQHLFYPYLIFISEKQAGSGTKVLIIKKIWKDKKLVNVGSPVRRNLRSRFGFAELIKVYKKDPDNQQFNEREFQFDFTPDITKENKKYHKKADLRGLAAVQVTGKIMGYDDLKVTVVFNEESIGTDFNYMELGLTYGISATLISMSKDEIKFSFVKISKSKEPEENE